MALAIAALSACAVMTSKHEPLAQINNATATRADAVVRVVCGIPRYYKGG